MNTTIIISTSIIIMVVISLEINPEVGFGVGLGTGGLLWLLGTKEFNKLLHKPVKQEIK